MKESNCKMLTLKSISKNVAKINVSNVTRTRLAWRSAVNVGSCDGLYCVSLKFTCQSPNPNTLECYLTWKYGLYRSHRVRIRSLGLAVIHMTGVLTKVKFGDRHACKENAMRTQRQKSG